MSHAVVHASTVAFGPEGGIVIEGPSGSGKSRLALLLMGEGAELVADDRTVLMASGGALYARAPRAIAGMIEARGLGILRLATRRLARVRLVIDLAQPEAAPRMPARLRCDRLGCEVDWLPARAGGAFARALALAMRRPGGWPVPA